MKSEEEKRKILGMDKLENVAGITRKLDTLGRITLPKETRKMLRMKSGEAVEMITFKNGIFVRKYEGK